MIMSDADSSAIYFLGKIYAARALIFECENLKLNKF